MLTVLFYGALIALVLWLVSRDKKNNQVDYNSKTYAQGYWDGYRAHQKEAGQPESTMPLGGATHNMAQIASPQPAVDSAAQKERHQLHNINTTLYVASFLLVASAVLFIGTTLPSDVKFLGLWLITAAFYGVGLYLHATVPKLQPAAVAFVGTGLALLPFTGLAMYKFILPDASLCWLVTSIIGLVAYVFATMRLQSQVVAYFAIAFMISLVSSGVATVDAGIVWYFVVLIGFASLVTIVATMKPKWLPQVFTQPIQHSSQLIVPLALIGSVIIAPALSTFEYAVIFGISAAYYFAVATPDSSTYRWVALLMARLLTTAFAVLLAYDIGDSYQWVSWILALAGVVHVAVSVGRMYKNKADASDEVWLWGGFSLLLLAPLFAIGANWAEITAWEYTALGVSALVSSYLLRRASPLYFTLFSLLALPPVIGFGVIEPALQSYWVAISYIIIAAVCLYLRGMVVAKHPSLRLPLIVGYALFVVATLACTFSLEKEWNLFVWIATSALLYAAVFIERQPHLTVVANIAAIFSIGWLVTWLKTPSEWEVLVIGWIALAIFYGGYLLLSFQQKPRHAKIMLWTAILAGGFLSLTNTTSIVDDIAAAASGTLVAVALLVAYEGANRQNLTMYSISIILGTFGLQRLLAIFVPGIDGLVYSHWWAAAFIALGYLYYRSDKKITAKKWLIVGLAVITFFSGINALVGDNGETPYKLIFLVEHAVMLAVGLALTFRLLSIWGAVGVVLAVLWMLSGYTFLLLGFIALLLIGSAVYMLNKKPEPTDKKKP